MDIVVLPDAAALARHGASLVEAEATAPAKLLVGLSGGSTPRAMHEDLATRAIEWGKVTTWISDERWVPPDSPDSNARMARETLTDRVGAKLLAPDTTLKDPATAARTFADVIEPELTMRGTRSIVFLGLGTDGHTASLFPNTPALGVGGPSYVENYVPKLDTWRLTATFGLIALADIVVFLVAGESKAPIVREIADGVAHPAASVTAGERVLWLLDRDAASGLEAT